MTIWFYGRISLHFMFCRLPRIEWAFVLVLKKRTTQCYRSSHLTMSFYWYYQFFINIIFILLGWGSERGSRWKVVKIKCQWRNGWQIWIESNESVTIHNAVGMFWSLDGEKGSEESELLTFSFFTFSASEGRESFLFRNTRRINYQCSRSVPFYDLSQETEAKFFIHPLLLWLPKGWITIET